MVKNYLAILDYDMPLIWCNGAGVSDFGGKILHLEEIEVSKIRSVIDIARAHGLVYVAYSFEAVISETRHERVLWMEDYNFGVDNEHKAKIIIDENLYENIDQHRIVKMFISSNNPDELEDIRDVINKDIDGVEAVLSQKHILDVVNKGVTKGNAVLALAKRFNIDPKEVIAIGDNHNDLSMLRVCGLPLTLENGEDVVKEVSEYIVRDNNSSGVAHAIGKFIL